MLLTRLVPKFTGQRLAAEPNCSLRSSVLRIHGCVWPKCQRKHYRSCHGQLRVSRSRS